MKHRPLATRLASFAPLVSLVVLIAMARWLPTRVQPDEHTDRRDVILATIEQMPFFIGDAWVGEDRPELAPEAQKLLKPTASFNRRYERSGGPWVQVLFVHCADARDMIGHWPPVCYPSAGWIPRDVMPPTRHAIDAGAARLPVQEYEFRAVQEDGRNFDVRIFNAFILPDGRVTTDIADINKMSERLQLSLRGVAQVQIITSATVDRGAALDASGEVLAGMDDLLEVLGVHEGATRDAR